MDFELLKRIHLRNIIVVLKSGEEYHGIIVSHSFVGTSMVVDYISLMNDNYLVRINCKEIKSIIDSETNQHYHFSI